MDQSQCSADLSLSEDELIAEGRHFLCASKMRPKSGSFRFHDLRHTGAVLAAATGCNAGGIDAAARPHDGRSSHALPARGT